MKIDKVAILKRNYSVTVKTEKEANKAAESIWICMCCGWLFGDCGCQATAGIERLSDYWQRMKL